MIIIIITVVETMKLTKKMMEGIGVLHVLCTMASALGMWPLRAATNTNLEVKVYNDFNR